MRLIAFAGNMGSGKDTAASVLVENGFVRIALADELKRLARKLFGLSNLTLFGPSDERNREFETSPEYWDTVLKVMYEHRFYIRQLFLDAPELLNDPYVKLKNIVNEQLRGPTCSARKILQKLGTDWAREGVWQDVWVAYVGNIYQQLKISGWGYTAENGIDPNIKCTYSGVVITDVRFKNEMLFVHQWSGKVYWIDALKRVPLKDHFKHASEPGYETMSDCVDGVIDNNKDTACFKQQIQLLLNTSIRD
jgi:hypothetical protein